MRRGVSSFIFLPLFYPGKSYPKPAIMQIVSWNGTRSLLWRWYTRLTDLSWLTRIRSELHFFQYLSDGNITVTRCLEMDTGTSCTCYTRIIRSPMCSDDTGLKMTKL